MGVRNKGETCGRSTVLHIVALLLTRLHPQFVRRNVRCVDNRVRPRNCSVCTEERFHARIHHSVTLVQCFVNSSDYSIAKLFNQINSYKETLT